MSWRWAIWVAIAGCGSSGAPPAKRDEAAKTSPVRADAAAPKVALDVVVHHVSSAGDLQLPLTDAAVEAEQAGARELRVLIAPGVYDLDHVLIAPYGEPGAFGVTVEADGAGVVTLRGAQVSLTGRTVTLRGVVIDGARHDSGVLKLRAADEIVVERVAIVDSSSGASDLDAPIVSLQSPTDQARATLRDVWLVGNRTVDAAVVEIPVNGRSRFEQVTLERVVFAGNTASASIETWMAKHLEVRASLAVEPLLTGPWMEVGTFADLAVRDSLIAVRKGLVTYRGDGETKPDDFPKLVVERVELRGPGKKEPIDAREVTYGKAPAVDINLSSALEAARAGTAPDVAALRAVVDAQSSP